MRKIILALSLTLLTQSFAFASGTVKLVDFMLSGSGVVEVLGKYGIKGNDAKQVESYVGSALAALGSKKSLSKEELMDALSKLPVTGQDASVRKELQMLLDKSEGCQRARPYNSDLAPCARRRGD